jgi:exodeoxyribonuclease-5
MVNDRMMEDILSFDIPIIGIGDSAQLPPIMGTNRFMNDPDIFLTEIMRQKGDLGILDLATLARNGEYIRFGNYTESRVIRMKDLDDIEKYDIVLCWRNASRQNFNSIIRAKIGRNTTYPVEGDKLLCLKNNYVHLLNYQDDVPVLLVNGMGMIARSTAKEDAEKCFELSYAPTYVTDDMFVTPVHRGPFDSYKTDKEFVIIGDEAPEVAFLDFGYACTVHKSQGSEFDNVLVVDEFKGPDDMYNKWLYTAITRAKKRVTIARYF